jgi:hypothetical protein
MAGVAWFRRRTFSLTPFIIGMVTLLYLAAQGHTVRSATLLGSRATEMPSGALARGCDELEETEIIAPVPMARWQAQTCGRFTRTFSVRRMSESGVESKIIKKRQRCELVAYTSSNFIQLSLQVGIRGDLRSLGLSDQFRERCSMWIELLNERRCERCALKKITR